MSSPSQVLNLVGEVRQDLVPGKTLSAPRLIELGLAEQFFATEYLKVVVAGTAALPPQLRKEVIQFAVEDVKNGGFAWGGTAHDKWALSAMAMPKLLLWSLQVEHPQTTDEHVTGILASPTGVLVADGVWQLWGYGDFEPKKSRRGPGMTRAAAGASTGGSSSESSPPPPPPAGTPSDTPKPASSPSTSSST